MSRGVHCPEIDVLERYVAAELDLHAAQEFESHLQLCGLCSELVERLREFDSVAADLTPEPDWTLAERRIEKACQDQARPHAAAKPAAAYWWSGSRLVASLGYGLALVLVYPAWLGLTRRTAPVLNRPPILQAKAITGASARVLDLNTSRGAQAPSILGNQADAGVVALLFFVPVAPQVRPLVQLRDESDSIVRDFGQISSYDRNGNFCLVIDVDELKQGRYHLLARAEPAVNGGGRTFTFPFERH